MEMEKICGGSSFTRDVNWRNAPTIHNHQLHGPACTRVSSQSIDQKKCRGDCKINPSDLSHELLLCFRNPTMAAAVPTVNLLHLPAKSSELRLFVAGAYSILRLRTSGLWSPVVATKLPSIEAVRCVTKPENLSSDEEEEVRESQQDSLDAARPEVSNGSAVSKTLAGDSLHLGIREPVYQVIL